MPEPNDGGGGGGGTSDPGGICWVSPADMAGQINNLLTRVAQLESVLNQLLGVDITAIDAADIAPGLGTIIGGVWVSSGDTAVLSASMAEWAGTTLPGDFTGTVISGNVMMTWTNGVVVFSQIGGGIASSGGVAWINGQPPPSGAAAPVDYAVRKRSGGDGYSNLTELRGITKTLDTISSNSPPVGRVEFTVSQAGLYLATFHAYGGTSDWTDQLDLYGTIYWGTDGTKTHTNQPAQSEVHDHYMTFGMSVLMLIGAGSVVGFLSAGSGGASWKSDASVSASLYRISD